MPRIGGVGGLRAKTGTAQAEPTVGQSGGPVGVHLGLRHGHMTCRLEAGGHIWRPYDGTDFRCLLTLWGRVVRRAMPAAAGGLDNACLVRSYFSRQLPTDRNRRSGPLWGFICMQNKRKVAYKLLSPSYRWRMAHQAVFVRFVCM